MVTMTMATTAMVTTTMVMMLLTAMLTVTLQTLQGIIPLAASTLRARMEASELSFLSEREIKD